MVEDIGVARKRLDTESELWTTPFAEFEFDWSDCDVLRAYCEQTVLLTGSPSLWSPWSP